MAYSTQNMYQMFDIIPNFVRKMFPLSLKTYPSCTNTTWDIRDEIRSAYILRMVHQRDNQKATIDGPAKDGGGGCRLALISDVDKSLQSSVPSSPSERLLFITNIDKQNSAATTTTKSSTKKLNGSQTNSQPKLLYRKSSSRSIGKSNDLASSSRSSGQTIPLLDNSLAANSQNSIAKIDDPAAAKPTVQREYQLLAQKFHQYTINCRATIRTLEKRLKKLIDDKHALLHGVVSLRKGQKDVIKKYRKIFNDAMNEHCNEINALLANYKVIRDNYLELLQQDPSFTDKNPNEEVISVSYTSYNCC